jgi:hypothetical protein
VVGLTMVHLSREKKEDQPSLAGSEERLKAFLVFQGRPESCWWWKRWLRSGGGASQIGSWEGEKMEEKWPKKLGRDDCFSTLASVFFLIQLLNSNLYIRGGSGKFCL